ncbi:MAG: ABC transporter ATP-binding protein [Brachymonas sp.]|nr:ABC transporter ATP-binding protein [Brachymonas sp.]
MESVLNVENLSFFYDKETKILNEVSLKFEKNKITGIFGPNGCGKTTLLKCLANIFKNYKGAIRLNEKNLKTFSPLETSKFISFVPQEHGASFPYQVYEMVLMGRNPGMSAIFAPSLKDIKICEKALKETGIMDMAFRAYTNLSGGQRQLVLITRAIAQETPIMILDEPTSALDFRNQINLWTILNELKEREKTIIVCTHDPNHIIWFCDNVVVMNNGEIIKSGPVESVMDISALNILYGNICSMNDFGVFPKFKNKRIA